MADLDADFEAAVANSKKLPQRPDNATLLKMYGLYKQATAGDVTGRRPGALNPVGRAKHDAWASVTGLSSEQAKRDYVQAAAELRG